MTSKNYCFLLQSLNRLTKKKKLSYLKIGIFRVIRLENAHREGSQPTNWVRKSQKVLGSTQTAKGACGCAARSEFEIYIDCLNKDTCLWKHGFKTRQEEKLFDEVKYKAYIHPNEVRPRLILSIPKKWTINLRQAKLVNWPTIGRVTLWIIIRPPFSRHRITSTQQCITQMQESG